MQALPLIGWREWCALPVLGLPAVRAKVDTGARSSALHVDLLEEFQREGVDFVRFAIEPGRAGLERSVLVEAPVTDRRVVTDSGGHRSLRVFIRTPLRLSGAVWDIELNLCRRHDMRFPMLLGRTAIAGRFLVDPSRSWLATGVPR